MMRRKKWKKKDTILPSVTIFKPVKQGRFLPNLAGILALLSLVVLFGCQAVPVQTIPNIDLGWTDWEELPNSSPPDSPVIYNLAVERNWEGGLELFIGDHYGRIWNCTEKTTDKSATWDNTCKWHRWPDNINPNLKVKRFSTRTIFRNDSKTGGKRIEVYTLSTWSDILGRILRIQQEAPQKNGKGIYTSLKIPWLDENTACRISSEKHDISNIDATYNEDGRSEVFCVCDLGSIWHMYQKTIGWSSWIDMGLPNDDGFDHFESLAVGKNRDGRLEVFAIGNNGNLYHKYQEGANRGPWHGWFNLVSSKNLTGYEQSKEKKIKTVTVGQFENGRLVLFVTVEGRIAMESPAELHTRYIYYMYQSEPNKGPWLPLSPFGNTNDYSLTERYKLLEGSSIKVIRNKRNGCLEVFAFAENQKGDRFDLLHIYQKEADKDEWGYWSKIGGEKTFDDSPLSKHVYFAVGQSTDRNDSSSRLEVFAVFANRIWTTRQK